MSSSTPDEAVLAWNQRYAAIMEARGSLEDALLDLSRLFVELLASYSDAAEKFGSAAHALERVIAERDALLHDVALLRTSLESEMFRE
jgi:hypothetical protein